MTMPGMTGIELAGKLKDMRSDIPIVLCTGYSDSINEQRIRDIGIYGMLEKPADIDELEKVIREALGRECRNS
jgi:CheY-like chemotaxis protein